MVTLIEVVSRFTYSVLNERFLILGEMVKPSLCSCMGNENAHIIIVHSTHSTTSILRANYIPGTAKGL